MAVMEWSNVQEERPRASTSGGQSGGIEGVDAVAVVAAAVVPVTLPGFAVSFLAMAIHDATLVQLRQLEKYQIQGSR